ncbi:MAG: hypothetical protein JNL98_37040 [Bryobacterales bacterium]|nr:hypothetical protein [Bryobacterales bacterium]
MAAESVFMKGGNLRRLCEVTFRDGKTALVEPYAIYTAETKRRLYLWYQISSDPPEEPGWSTPEAANITAVRLREETFAPRPQYDPFDRKKYPVMHYSIPTADGRQRWMDAKSSPSDKQDLHAGR